MLCHVLLNLALAPFSTQPLPKNLTPLSSPPDEALRKMISLKPQSWKIHLKRKESYASSTYPEGIRVYFLVNPGKWRAAVALLPTNKYSIGAVLHLSPVMVHLF